MGTLISLTIARKLTMSATPPCPECGSDDFVVTYSIPSYGECKGCGTWWKDANSEILVLSEEDGRSKRPGLYGDPVCSCCPHAPHEGLCRWCNEPPRGTRWVPCKGS